MKKITFKGLILATSLFSSISHAAFVCEPGGTEGPLQTVRNFYWMAMGFPGTTEYACFHRNDDTIKAIVGQDGLVGRINGIREYVVEKIIAREGSSITCQTVPTSGSFSISGTETLTYQTATQTPPSSFTHTTAYDKRVRYQNTGTGRDAIFEFHCDRSSMMAKITDTLDGGDQTIVVFYDGENSSAKQLDFYMYDQGNFGNNLKMAVVTRTNGNEFSLWTTRSGGTNAGDVEPYRFAVKSDFTTGAATIFYHDVANKGLTTGNYTAETGINDVDVTSAVAPNGGAQYDKRHGCASSFSIETSTIASAAECTGLAIDATPNNAFGSSMSMQSIEQNLAAGVSGI